MSAAAGQDTGRPAHHVLPAAQFAALARGDGGPDAVATLRAAQLSKRLVLLRALGEAAQQRTQWAAVWRRGYALLARVQRHAPQAVADVLLLPQVGEWAADTLRRVRAGAAGDALAHIGAVAAAAAIGAGTDFAVEIPVADDGAAALPGLGCAVVPGGGEGAGSRALLRREGGRITLETGALRTLSLPADLARAAPGWHPLRRLACSAGGLDVDLALDDVDPYRDPHGLGAAARTTAEQHSAWQHGLAGAWRLLVEDHPRHAAAIAAGLRVLVPLDGAASGTGRNATSADSFGATLMAPPADPTAFALGLLHEFQHAKLNALLDFTPLYTDPGEPRHYAPWRPDPRPVPALLHGIYAHAAVAEFWQRRRYAGTGGAADFAHYEFARWRDQTANAAATAAADGLLTDAGARLVAELRARLDELEGEVPEPAAGAARAAARDHALLWRLRNLRPDPAAVAEIAAAWRRGGRPEPRPVGCVITAADAVDGIDARMELRALLLRDPRRFGDLATGRVDPAEAATSATPAGAADTALVAGRTEDARAGYSALIAESSPAHPPHTAWAGLALAAAPDRARPEVALAVHTELRGGGAAPPDPARLLAWLTETGRDPAPEGVRRAAIT